MVDTLDFIIPKKYKSVLLSDFQAVLKYVNPANCSKAEFLVLKNPDYKTDFLLYQLPVTTEITKFAGNVKLYLTFTRIDPDTKIKYITNSEEYSINVHPVNDYFVDDASLSAIDQKILELQEIVNEYKKAKADGIKLDTETNEIYLTNSGEQLNEPIELNTLGNALAESTKNGLVVVEF